MVTKQSSGHNTEKVDMSFLGRNESVLADSWRGGRAKEELLPYQSKADAVVNQAEDPQRRWRRDLVRENGKRKITMLLLEISGSLC